MILGLPCVEWCEYQNNTHAIEYQKADQNIPLKEWVVFFQVIRIPPGTFKEQENMVDLWVAVSHF